MAVKDSTPWEYSKGNSFLHRLPGAVKLLCLLGFTTGVFFSGIAVLPFCGLFIFTIAFAAKIKPWELLRGSLPLIVFILVIFAAGCLDFAVDGGRLNLRYNDNGIRDGLVFSLRIALSYSAGALFFKICTMSEIKRTLGRAESFLHLEKLQISLALSLMICFLPRFFVNWEDLNLAMDSRAGRRGFARIVKILPATVERLMQKAAETAEAMESRGVF